MLAQTTVALYKALGGGWDTAQLPGRERGHARRRERRGFGGGQRARSRNYSDAFRDDGEVRIGPGPHGIVEELPDHPIARPEPMDVRPHRFDNALSIDPENEGKDVGAMPLQNPIGDLRVEGIHAGELQSDH